MRRVLSSRDGGQQYHHQDELLELESEGLVSSRVKGIYSRGDVEIILDDNDNQLSSPTPLVKRKSSLTAYSIKRVFSKRKDDQWESTSQASEGEQSFISESIESSSSNPFTVPNSQRSKKWKRCNYFVYRVLLAAIVISAGVAGTGIYLLKAGGEDGGGGEGSNVVVMMGGEEDEGNTSAVEESIGSLSSVGEDVAVKVTEVVSKENNAVEDVTVVKSSETAADDDISLSVVIDATTKLESTVSNVTVEDDVDEDETMDTITIGVNVTTDIVVQHQSIPVTTTTAPPTLSDIVEESNETAADDISLSGVVDAAPKLESAVSNITNSTAYGDADEDETIDTITIAANVTADIVDEPIPATTTTAPPPSSDTITTFYVMADGPYTDHERNNLMPKLIEELDDTVEFLVHLGDLSSAGVDKCREGAYVAASTIMQKSRIPTFILPGDNDINDCKSMIYGEEMWTKYYALFDKRYDHSLNVTRWGKLNESFSFIHKEVLYLGLNIIGGTPASISEKTFRHNQHLERIRAIFNDQLDNFKVVVLLGHAEPRQSHFDFFQGDAGFISMIREMGKPTIHFHGDCHVYYEREAEYGVDNYMRISLDGESTAPPILVTIDTSKTNPVKVDRRSENLEVACCNEGWPRYENTPRPN